LLTTLPLAAGCAHGARGQQVSQAPPTPVAPADGAMRTPAPPTAAAMPSPPPIPGHPPVTTSGVVASYDPATDVVTFKDGRIMKLTDQSTVLQPVDRRAVRPGEPVVVRNALPVGVQSAKASTKATGKRQRMATVASVDQQKRLISMTDGSTVHVQENIPMHMGTDGAAVLLTDLRPGDELLIVIADAPAAAAGTTAPSALPRAAADPAGTPTPPDEASELMVFRNREAP